MSSANTSRRRSFLTDLAFFTDSSQELDARVLPFCLTSRISLVHDPCPLGLAQKKLLHPLHTNLANVALRDGFGGFSCLKDSCSVVDWTALKESAAFSRL